MKVTEQDEEPWIPFEHVILINEALMDVAAGRIRRLAISMPPQHGKSEIVSKFFTSWYLGTYPTRNVIQTMYEASLAHEYGGKARDIISEFGPDLFGVGVDPRSKARKAWHTWDVAKNKRFGGAMYTAGARGPITSRGAHVLIIDDPIKGIADALSPLMREQTYEWYQAVAKTRLRKGGAIVLVQTRWHFEDLAGKVIKRSREGGDAWVELNLPALAEEDDPLGREPGDPLCEYLHPASELLEVRADTDAFWWNAMYQGRPSPRDGGIVQRGWWQYYTFAELPKWFDEIIQSWDMSFERMGDKRSSAKGPDYVVGQTWGRAGAYGFLLAERRIKASFSDTIDAVTEEKRKWTNTGLGELTSILVELKSAGPAIVWALQEKIPGIEGVRPVGSKEVRLHSVSPMIKAGQMFVPDPTQNESTRWVADWVEEWSIFPSGPDDDRVDAGVQAMQRIRYRANLSLHGGVEQASEAKESHWSGEHLK